MKPQGTWISKSKTLQRCQCSKQPQGTRDASLQAPHKLLLLLLRSHLPPLIPSPFCSTQFYGSALCNALPCSLPLIFHINLYNWNLFFFYFSSFLKISPANLLHVFSQKKRTKKKVPGPEDGFNFISWSFYTFYVLSPGTSLAFILTEIYLFRRRNLPCTSSKLLALLAV